MIVWSLITIVLYKFMNKLHYLSSKFGEMIITSKSEPKK